MPRNKPASPLLLLLLARHRYAPPIVRVPPPVPEHLAHVPHKWQEFYTPRCPRWWGKRSIVNEAHCSIVSLPKIAPHFSSSDIRFALFVVTGDHCSRETTPTRITYEFPSRFLSQCPVVPNSPNRVIILSAAWFTRLAISWNYFEIWGRNSPLRGDYFFKANRVIRKVAFTENYIRFQVDSRIQINLLRKIAHT